MEVVKEHKQDGNTVTDQKSFNPCFNGSCKRTGQELKFSSEQLECFNPCFNGSCKRTMASNMLYIYYRNVSILVLMEVVKELMPEVLRVGNVILSFNPCFNGSCKRTRTNFSDTISKPNSFNPCFNGSCKRTRFIIIYN